MAAYFVCGALASILIAVTFVDKGTFLPDVFTGHFIISACILFPCSFVLNCVLVRWFRRRTWRGEARRYWLGAFLGVLITWGGIVLIVLEGLGTAIYLAMVHSIDSTTLALSWLMLLCNLSMVTAWLLPGKRSSRR
jgi:hypothetical protein